jgi:hypothetical protein
VKINLEHTPKGMKLTAQLPGPLSDGQRGWLEYELSTLRDGNLPRGVPWVFSREPDDGFTAVREFEGLKGWDSLLLWLRWAPADLERMREISAKMRKEGKKSFMYEDAVDVLPFELFLNGTPTNLDELHKLYEALPEVIFELGEFQLSQPKMLVTDPCYEPGTWCTGTLEALPGKWRAQTVVGPTSWYLRTKQLRVRHESIDAKVFEQLENFEDSGVDAGVDSGQCGFFDSEVYAKVQPQGREWYDKICDLTIDTTGGGGISPEGAGAVSQSGFGDGGYGVKVLRKSGKVVAAVLVYVGAEEDDLDDEDEEELENS